MQDLKIKISFLIVTYNNEKSIEKCLTSLIKNLPDRSQIIVVDNSSSDETVNVLKKFGNKIKLFQSNQNLGYGKANNLAQSKATGEYIFILNPDTEIKKPIFDEMMNFYQSDQTIGLVVPKLILPKGEVQASIKKLPTVWGAFKEYILGNKHSYSEYAPDMNTPTQIEAAYGAAMLIKKSLFEKLGGFDERYFLYYEDIDLCRKLKRIGKKIFYFPKAEITHLVGGSATDKNRYTLNYASSRIYHGYLSTFLLQLIFKIHRVLSND